MACTARRTSCPTSPRWAATCSRARHTSSTVRTSGVLWAKRDLLDGSMLRDSNPRPTARRNGSKPGRRIMKASWVLPQRCVAGIACRISAPDCGRGSTATRITRCISVSQTLFRRLWDGLGCYTAVTRYGPPTGYQAHGDGFVHSDAEIPLQKWRFARRRGLLHLARRFLRRYRHEATGAGQPDGLVRIGAACYTRPKARSTGHSRWSANSP